MTKTIKYKGKKMIVSEDDFNGIKFAQTHSRDRVDIQVKAGKDKYETAWLNMIDITV